MINITAEDFRSYLEVQISGKYNMFSSDAIYETGLTKNEYFTILENYKELIEKHKDSNECKHLIERLGYLK